MPIDDTDDTSNWPKNETFWVTIETQSDDGAWSGYAETEDYQPYRPVEREKAILFSAHERITNELLQALESHLSILKQLGGNKSDGSLWSVQDVFIHMQEVEKLLAKYCKQEGERT